MPLLRAGRVPGQNRDLRTDGDQRQTARDDVQGCEHQRDPHRSDKERHVNTLRRRHAQGDPWHHDLRRGLSCRQADRAETFLSWNNNNGRTGNGLDQAYLRSSTTAILPHIVSSTTSSHRLPSSQSLLPDQPVLERNPPINQSEIVLRPTRTTDPTRGKPLRIIDFVSRLRSSEEERVFASDNNCVLKLSLQDTKPKLSSVTIEQFNIANLRIFYELFFTNKLSSMQEIREYLAYSIKVLELAAKYTWQSVLLYDDEFRVLQHTYGYPWSTDHSHLHEVLLIPRWAAKSNATGVASSPSNSLNGLGNLKSFTVAHLPNGEEICRLFNSKKGCLRSPCKYSHVCNRKVGSQACGKDHQGFLHPPAE